MEPPGGATPTAEEHICFCQPWAGTWGWGQLREKIYWGKKRHLVVFPFLKWMFLVLAAFRVNSRDCLEIPRDQRLLKCQATIKTGGILKFSARFVWCLGKEFPASSVIPPSSSSNKKNTTTLTFASYKWNKSNIRTRCHCKIINFGVVTVTTSCWATCLIIFLQTHLLSFVIYI